MNILRLMQYFDAAAHIIIRSIAAAVVAAEIVCVVVTALESAKRGAV